MLFLSLLKLMFLQPSMPSFIFYDFYTKTKGLFSYLNILFQSVHTRACVHTHSTAIYSAKCQLFCEKKSEKVLK